MTWVFRVGNQTLRITASNAAEALRRAKIVFPGQTISGVREGGQSGDANFRLINPSYIDAQNNPVYTAESTTGDPTGARASDFTRDTFTTADPARDTGDGQLPTPEGLGPGAQPVLPAAFGGQLEQQSPFGAFSNFLGAYGLGSGTPHSAGRTFAESQFDPTLAAFRGQQLAQGIDVGSDFDRLPESMGNEFSRYISGGGWNPRQRLGESFRALQGAAPGVAGLAPGEGGFLQAALNPQSATEAFPVFDLARQLQSSRISPLVSRFFRQEAPDKAFDRFAAQRAGAGIGGGLNALDFARQQYGLGQLGF
mgnify:CR=1 FL=1